MARRRKCERWQKVRGARPERALHGEKQRGARRAQRAAQMHGT